MKLVNEFRVRVPAERAWAVLTDLEQIAPSMPGAQLTGVDGDDYHGTVKIKVGPVSAQYQGTATMKEKDDSTYRAVILARGKDTRGQGNADATITAYLTPEADGTLVTVDTDLAITGKVAQFGRSLLGDVSAKLMNQFVANLESTVLAPEPIPSGHAAAAEVEAAPAPTTGLRPVTTLAGPEPQAVNAFALIAGPLAKRIAPVAAGLGVLVLLVGLVRRLRRPAAPARSGGAGSLVDALGGSGPVFIVLGGDRAGGLLSRLEDSLVTRTPTDVP
jgi:carbon monoxide dehydrogenase subunit G